VIDDICAGAHVRNGELDMTGILTVNDGRFFIADGPIEMRRYRDWRVVYRDPKEFVRDQLDTVLAQMALMGRMVSHQVY